MIICYFRIMLKLHNVYMHIHTACSSCSSNYFWFIRDNNKIILWWLEYRHHYSTHWSMSITSIPGNSSIVKKEWSGPSTQLKITQSIFVLMALWSLSRWSATTLDNSYVRKIHQVSAAYETLNQFQIDSQQ